MSAGKTRPRTLTIRSPDGAVQASFAPARGALGTSLILPGPGGPRETLYMPDPASVPPGQRTRGGLPFLFPVCGRLNRLGETGAYLLDFRVRRLAIHGFSWDMPWKVTGHTAAEITLRLRDTPATRAAYPFAFEVTLRYTARADALVCRVRIENRSSRPLPYYGGFHPYFLTPPPGPAKDDVKVVYRPRRCLAYNGTLTDVVGDRPKPRNPVSVSDPSIHELLSRMGPEKEVRLRFPDGFVLGVEARGRRDPDLFPWVQLFTDPAKPFFCIEPWMGFPNALNTVEGVRRLRPGTAEEGTLRIRSVR